MLYNTTHTHIYIDVSNNGDTPSHHPFIDGCSDAPLNKPSILRYPHCRKPSWSQKRRNITPNTMCFEFGKTWLESLHADGFSHISPFWEMHFPAPIYIYVDVCIYICLFIYLFIYLSNLFLDILHLARIFSLDFFGNLRPWSSWTTTCMSCTDGTDGTKSCVFQGRLGYPIFLFV